MSAPRAPRRQLPAHPSSENLRKQAKALAKTEGLQLAAAQRRLAAEYGYVNWAALMRAVMDAASATAEALYPLSTAAARADEAAVRALLAQGEPADGRSDEVNRPLWRVCASDAPIDQRLAVAALLLDAGASPRRHNEDETTALHAAARHGPLAMVEFLIRRGALSWQPDRRGRDALHYARRGTAADKDAIVALLDRPVIRDPNFRAAVRAIHAGDLAALNRLLDAHPNLLHDRAVEPDCYPTGYFRDPKLFWFIANNPTLMRRVPQNIVDIGRAMIARGIEQADLDYTLELAMTNGDTGPQGRQADLVALLLDAGAHATPQAIVMTLAHWSTAPVEALLARGLPITAPIAAALGWDEALAGLLAHATPAERQDALGLAVINRKLNAARLCLDAGADPNHFLPVHRHSTPLHQAASNDDIAMLKLLVERGARIDTPDTLWDVTPLGWAVHGKHRAAEGYLRSLAGGGVEPMGR